MENLKKRTGADQLTEAQLAALKADLAKEPTGIWAKLSSTNFIASAFFIFMSLWIGNSEELAKAGAQNIVGSLAFIHALRTYLSTSKFDIKRWALNSNTWAALLTIVTTFVAVPADLVSGITNLGTAIEGGNIAAIASALFYIANVVLQLIRNNKKAGAVAVTMCLVVAGVNAQGVVQDSDTSNSEGWCKVVRVVDGDTYDILTQGTKVRVRIIGADCPETVGYSLPQPHGRAATDSVKKWYMNKYVKFHVYGTDYIGRTVVRLWDGDTDVSLRLIEKGLAWYYPRPKSAKNQARLTRGEIAQYSRAQRNAKKAGAGLWAGYADANGNKVEPIEPKTWRKTFKR